MKNKPSNSFAEFQFDPTALAAPRKPGISAYMRIKNGGEFLRLAIVSHLQFYDEIIAVYNDCTDDTEATLFDLQNQYPDTIKIFHYLPKVHPCQSDEHTKTPTDSVHSMANYFNYALSKTTYNVATKLDDDHLAIPCNLTSLTKTIRADNAVGKQKIYTFSGINLMREGSSILAGGLIEHPFSGNGDIYYHPVSKNIFFSQRKSFERMNRPHRKEMENEYMGIMYFHLKYLKQDFGYANLSHKVKKRSIEKLLNESLFVPYDEFRSKRHYKRLKKALSKRDQFWCAFWSVKALRKLRHSVGGKHLSLLKMRFALLADDLKNIDFRRDVLDKLN